MNQRIRELAEQAGINCVVPTVGTLEYSGKGEIEHLKKFAELIVWECIDIVGPYAVRMENFDGGHPIADLKKHFGVEE